MKKYFPFLIIPFTVCADTCTLYQEGGGEWRIVCEGNGIVTRYEDVTNEVFVIADCEIVKSNLLEKAEYTSLRMYSALDEVYKARDCVRQLEPDMLQFYPDGNQVWNNLKTSSEYATIFAGSSLDHIESLMGAISEIQCGSCSTNGAIGGGSSGSCCAAADLTPIIDRLNVAEQQRAIISNQLIFISYNLGVITNQLAYSNFLQEHGWNDATNLLLDISYATSLTNRLIQPVKPLTYLGYRRVSENDGIYSETDKNAIELQGTVSAIGFSMFDFMKVLSLNSAVLPTLANRLSWMHDDFLPYSDETTNFFSFFRGEIGVRGVLEDWTSEQVDGTYHDFLTNHYINVVRGGSLSGYQAEKTNWFARIETLLASLVFLDSSNTNSYNEAAASVSNSISRVKDDFNNTLDNVSSATSTQMELVSDIEKSMYESLQSFSKAFSSASLPSTVQLLYVHRTSGAKSLPSSDSVDVTVPVEGDLMDFIEIIRSCTTLCWVFFGLWFMFKFSVWTVKKIYVLIRYIIDFFNMVAGGK